MELKKSLPALVEPIIKKAGELVLSYFRNDVKYKEKYDGELVTESDFASEQYLIKHLRPIIPGASFLSEEEGKSSGSNGNDYQWVIDPLDGTTNFIYGIPYFCISVALTLDGVPQFGAVYQPATDEYWYAQIGQGAFLNGSAIHVSSMTELNRSVIAIGFPYEKGSEFHHLWQLTSEIISKARAFRHFGAAALDLAYLATGRLDGLFFEKLTWWDVAAGVLLVREAGGMVSDFEGKAIDAYYKSLVASGPVLYKQLQDFLSSH